MAMTSSTINIFVFLLSTILYYFLLKPKLVYETFTNPTAYNEYMTKHYKYLTIYLLGSILLQFGLNTAIITNQCGGSVTENLAFAGLATLIPWILIFGSIIVTLMIFPNFKSAFADVIGYFYVSSSANKLLSELLVNQDVNRDLSSDPSISQEQRDAMQKAAETIVKICGNTSILINQIVPSNFDSYWNILTPLMKKEYQSNPTEMKQKLFDLVVSRDTVGEAMWYVYTGILLTSLVQLKITTHGCVVSPKTMEANYKKFLDEQEKAEQQKQTATETVYTVTA